MLLFEIKSQVKQYLIFKKNMQRTEKVVVTGRIYSRIKFNLHDEMIVQINVLVTYSVAFSSLIQTFKINTIEGTAMDLDETLLVLHFVLSGRNI